MQASPLLISSVSLNSYGDESQYRKAAAEVSEDFIAQLKITTVDNKSENPPPVLRLVEKTSVSNQDQRSELHEAREYVEEEEREEHDDDDDDFSFVCNGFDTSSISADDVFQNGQIRPFFPLFNRDLLLADGDFKASERHSSLRPPVKKVFVETAAHMPSTSLAENDEIGGVAAGPYCAWSKESPEVCKKSNSTGFSKLWRFKDYYNRSNSDGRDAFVFLNNATTATASVKREEKIVVKSEGPSEIKIDGKGSSKKKMTGEVKVNGGKAKVKKGVKSQTASLSAHEIYLRNRGCDENRRRSYLPYRAELVGLNGFFTTVNGGLSKNVHPF